MSRACPLCNDKLRLPRYIQPRPIIPARLMNTPEGAAQMSRDILAHLELRFICQVCDDEPLELPPDPLCPPQTRV